MRRWTRWGAAVAAYLLLALALFGQYLGPTGQMPRNQFHLRSPNGRYELLLHEDPQSRAGGDIGVRDSMTGQSQSWSNWCGPCTHFNWGWIADDGCSLVLMSAFKAERDSLGAIRFYNPGGLIGTIFYRDLGDGRRLLPLESSEGLSRGCRVWISRAAMTGSLLQVRTTGLWTYTIDPMVRRIVGRSLNWGTVLRFLFYLGLCAPAVVQTAMVLRRQWLRPSVPGPSVPRRTLKWLATAVCVLLLSLRTAGEFKVISYWNHDNGFHIGVLKSEAFLYWRDGPLPPSSQPGFSISDRWGHNWEPALLPRVEVEPYTRTASCVRITVPLWIPILLVGALTAFLWWQDRRVLSAHRCCTCGYDLTGNLSGRCPECGHAAEKLA